MGNSKSLREFEMGLISAKEYMRRLAAESGRGNIHDRYAAGLISFRQYNAALKNQSPKGKPNPDDPVLKKIGRVADTNIVVPDSRLGSRFGSNKELRRVKDPKLDRMTAHTDIYAENR